MQDLVINIEFNKESFVNSYKNIWRLSFKKARSSYYLNSAAALGLFLLGLWINESHFPTITSFGFFYLLYMLYKWTDLIWSKKKYFRNVAEIANQYKQENMTCTYTFTDENLKYRDIEKAYEFAWPLFEPYEIYNGYILLTLKKGKTATFTLSPAEAGDHYLEIINLLKTKTTSPAV